MNRSWFCFFFIFRQIIEYNCVIKILTFWWHLKTKFVHIIFNVHTCFFSFKVWTLKTAPRNSTAIPLHPKCFYHNSYKYSYGWEKWIRPPLCLLHKYGNPSYIMLSVHNIYIYLYKEKKSKFDFPLRRTTVKNRMFLSSRS